MNDGDDREQNFLKNSSPQANVKQKATSNLTLFIHITVS